MKLRPMFVLGVIAILGPIATWVGCSTGSTTTTIVVDEGGAGGSGPPLDTSCPDGTTPADAICNSTYAKSGAAPCTQNCCIPCGFNGVGSKICTCSNGAYIACPCNKPSSYLGADTAPYCDTLTSDGMGLTVSLRDLPCDTEWQQCVGRDVVDGATPRGCVCMIANGATTPTWSCGSTNKWFQPQ